MVEESSDQANEIDIFISFHVSAVLLAKFAIPAIVSKNQTLL